MDLSHSIRETGYETAEDALDRVIARINQVSVLVVGDVMLDEFVFGSVRRISPEAPVPVVEITARRNAPGGAANVASNVAALGASASLAGVTGDDTEAASLRALMASIQVDCSAVFEDASRPTTCKTRIVASGQQIVRIDQESAKPLNASLDATLTAAVCAALPHAGACIVSDYGKGIVSPALVAAIVAQAARYNVPVLVDPKGNDFRKYAGATLVTPNLKEAETAAGHPIAGQDDLIHAATRIMDNVPCKALLITQGAAGMTLFRRDAVPMHTASLARQVFDVTGAGDTVVATLALALACGVSMDNATLLANVAAGIAVEKPGTATVTLDEIRDRIRGSQSRP